LEKSKSINKIEDKIKTLPEIINEKNFTKVLFLKSTKSKNGIPKSNTK
jgi:hypothetical protein